MLFFGEQLNEAFDEYTNIVKDDYDFSKIIYANIVIAFQMCRREDSRDRLDIYEEEEFHQIINRIQSVKKYTYFEPDTLIGISHDNTKKYFDEWENYVRRNVKQDNTMPDRIRELEVQTTVLVNMYYFTVHHGEDGKLLNDLFLEYFRFTELNPCISKIILGNIVIAHEIFYKAYELDEISSDKWKYAKENIDMLEMLSNFTYCDIEKLREIPINHSFNYDNDYNYEWEGFVSEKLKTINKKLPGCFRL